MDFVRQARRYKPNLGDSYFELNYGITQQLDNLRPELSNRKFLDIGAGELPFADFYKGLNVHTCDIQQNSNGTIDTLIKPNERLPFSESSFNGIFLFDVLEHIKDDVSFIQDCNRILSPGGVIVGNVPFLYRFHEEPYDYRRYTPSGLQYLFQEIGDFQIKLIKEIGSPLFIAETILKERMISMSKLRRGLYKFYYKTLGRLSRYEEVCPKAPFSYFFYIIKTESKLTYN